MIERVLRRAHYVLARKYFPGGWRAQVRAFWHHVIRGYEYEICGQCGRPVGCVWRAPTAIWNFVTRGQRETTYTVRPGAAGAPPWMRSEGHGGIYCVRCFDEAAEERGLSLAWEAEQLR